MAWSGAWSRADWPPSALSRTSLGNSATRASTRRRCVAALRSAFVSGSSPLHAPFLLREGAGSAMGSSRGLDTALGPRSRVRPCPGDPRCTGAARGPFSAEACLRARRSSFRVGRRAPVGGGRRDEPFAGFVTPAETTRWCPAGRGRAWAVPGPWGRRVSGLAVGGRCTDATTTSRAGGGLGAFSTAESGETRRGAGRRRLEASPRSARALSGPPLVEPVAASDGSSMGGNGTRPEPCGVPFGAGTDPASHQRHEPSWC
jgi:hypothetical protein